jgi:hypothetical protein
MDVVADIDQASGLRDIEISFNSPPHRIGHGLAG